MFRKLKDAILFLESKMITFYLILRKLKIDRTLKIKGIPYVKNRGIFNLGKNVRINSRISANPIGGDKRCYFVVAKDAVLTIGNGVAISNTSINCYNSITIMDNVMIGGSCKIYDTDFHSLDQYERVTDDRTNIKTKPIIIKENAFIGGHSIILKGVEIGENSIVGAGSVVTRNIPDNEIWAGNPAKFIKKINNKI